MSLSPRNLVFWMTLFATVGTWLALPQRPSPLRVPSEPPPWIPLPASGMDASRESLRRLIDNSPDGNAFATSCTARDGYHADRYRLRISRDGWRDFRDIEFASMGPQLEVVVRDNPLLPSAVAAPVVVTLDKGAAEPIRRAWTTRALWHAEQPDDMPGCLDGAVVTLEACVRGRYAIRQHVCDDAYAEARALWRAVISVLPVTKQMPSSSE